MFVLLFYLLLFLFNFFACFFLVLFGFFGFGGGFFFFGGVVGFLLFYLLTYLLTYLFIYFKPNNIQNIHISSLMIKLWKTYLHTIYTHLIMMLRHSARIETVSIHAVVVACWHIFLEILFLQTNWSRGKQKTFVNCNEPGGIE